MKIISKFSFLVLFIAVLFTACQKENIDEIIPEEIDYQVDTVDVNPLIQQLRSFTTDGLHLDCISIPFPIDFLQASGNTITINSEDELDAAGMLTDTIVDFVYPFDVLDNNDETITIQSIEDLILAISSCAETVSDCSDQDAHVLLFFNALNILTLNNYVYDITYPVDLIVEGNQVTINNDDEYLPAVGCSPFDLLATELVYPITITQFGQEIILNSDEDVCQFYETLDEACENKPAHIQFFFNEGGGVPVNCAYFINYPLEITSNGNTIQVQTRDDYINELNSSPNAYNDIELVYPVNITKFNGDQQPGFETDADICEYLNNCQ